MSRSLIVDQSEFEELCDHICDAGLVAFDTEFVSESTYRPELGLLQFATPQRCAAVDPLRVHDLDHWWRLMADDETTVIVHGGQQEIRFCFERSQQPPEKLIDLQLAEGLRSRSYPLGYSALVLRVLGQRVHGGETAPTGLVGRFRTGRFNTPWKMSSMCCRSGSDSARR